ncbi:MAG: NTP transferase domain-containing protein [Myxococcales bacterium]
MRRACFVVPAAGRGSRLGGSGPKILTRVAPGHTIWSLLRQRMSGVADHVHLVLSPEGKAAFEAEAALEEAGSAGGRAEAEGRGIRADAGISLSVQPAPRGMGDAIFGAREHWAGYDDILVLWGDQLGISRGTLKQVAAAQSAPGVTLPLVRVERPYVQYQFDERGALSRVLQSREGDVCEPAGLSDVGLFGLSTAGLADAWAEFERLGTVGAKTGEANFLPFLSFLSTARSWPVRRVAVADAGEARGVNTPEDLAFFRAQRERVHE